MKSPERRVLKQLLEALLFEGIVSYSTAPSGSGCRFSFILGPHTYACEGAVGAFGRVRIDAASVRRLDFDDMPSEVSWPELVRHLPARASVKRALRQELTDTVRFCEWNLAELARPAASRHSLPYELLESTLDEGHPYHPCFKARSGFSAADHRQYGPEAANSFRLEWLAVRRRRLRVALPEEEEAFWRRELGDETWRDVRARLSRARLAWDDYGLIPLHPWQWARLAPRELAPAIENREIVPLGAFGDHYSATQSVRTLRNVVDDERAHVKLSLDVRITSGSRLLEPESVLAAPAISRWLAEIVASDRYFASQFGLVILAEYAGMHYEPPASPGALRGQVAALFREPVRRYLGGGLSAVPMNALAVTEANGLAFVHEWLERYGVERWLGRLLDVCVLPVWHLLAAHGVAVEAHAQNMILIHREGWPELLALRDFHDSVEYVPEFLADPGRLPRFEAIDAAYAKAPDDRHHRMSSVEALRELFMDSVFVFNLTELSWLLEARHGYLEIDFWRAVRDRLLGHVRSGWVSERRLAHLSYRAEFVRAESLLTRRLNARRAGEWHHLVRNPLHEEKT